MFGFGNLHFGIADGGEQITAPIGIVACLASDNFHVDVVNIFDKPLDVVRDTGTNIFGFHTVNLRCRLITDAAGLRAEASEDYRDFHTHEGLGAGYLD